MIAVVFTEFGPPDVLQVKEVATPVLKYREVLIRIRATPVSFGDLVVRNFTAVTPAKFHMPLLFCLTGRVTFGLRKPRIRILGSKFAGDVAAVGRDVTLFKEGDHVFGYRGPRMGAYAECLCMPERGVFAPKPANLGLRGGRRRALRERPVADIVQCGHGVRKALGINDLGQRRQADTCKLLISMALRGWLLSLDSNQEPSG